MLGLISILGAAPVTPGTIPTIVPGGDALPGGSVATTMVSGIMYYSLIFCLVGLVLSAGLWAVGAFSNNYTQSINGKKGFLICAGAAIAIGASRALINFFFGQGHLVSGGGTPGTA